MSGIINSAGSKSGVIGQTELDYEEGTHTVVHAQTDGTTFGMHSSYQKLGYTKIGRIVHCQGYIIIGSVTGTPAHTKFTLPFTCATGTPSLPFTGSQNCLTYEVDYDGAGVCLYIGQGQKFFQCISNRDNSSHAHAPARGGDEYAVSITYATDE